jgi:hypothetical protein
MKHPSLALPLFRIEWEHLPCFASLMQTPKSVSFPSFCLPLFSSWLVSPSSKHQDLKENWVHISPEFQTLMEECFSSNNQDTNHNLRDVESSNLSTCPSYTIVLFIFGSFHILRNLRISNMATFRRSTKIEILVVVKKNTKLMSTKTRCHSKINMQFIMD